MTTERLDQALVSRQLVRSRTKAKRLIQDSAVAVDGVVQTSPAHSVQPEASIVLLQTDGDVGRGAVKLRAAFDTWDILVSGLNAADLGASTGGFTQVLLERGASHVVALDVGHGQLDARLSSDPRVTVAEGVNAVDLSAEWWAEQGFPPCSLVVADLSFISLTKVMEPVIQTFGPDAHYVLLVKPQFEVGRSGLDGGIVKDPARQRAALDTVVAHCVEKGLPVRAVRYSPVTGEKGNVEYLVYASATASHHPAEWDGTITADPSEGV